MLVKILLLRMQISFYLIQILSYEIISNDVISKIKNTESSQEVFAICLIKNSLDLQIQTPILVLDNISDPGNLGTLLRSASWYGINNVLVTSKSVDIYNPKVVRSAMGAHFHINNLHQLSEQKIRSFLNDESINIIAATLNGLLIKILILQIIGH